MTTEEIHHQRRSSQVVQDYEYKEHGDPLQKFELRALEGRFIGLVEWLTDGGYLIIPYLRGYTGIGETLGGDTFYNTTLAARQFIWLLATVDDPLVNQLADRDCYRQSSSHERVENVQAIVDQLSRQKVLQGLRVLDIGCGMIPSFARCSRAFGAEVWTVDCLFSADSFEPSPSALERSFHIKGDIQEEGTIIQLLESSGGSFDIVTHAHLERDRSKPDFDAFRLLRVGGLYIPTEGAFIISREEPFSKIQRKIG
jgi:hypothetical protein